MTGREQEILETICLPEVMTEVLEMSEHCCSVMNGEVGVQMIGIEQDQIVIIGDLVQETRLKIAGEIDVMIEVHPQHEMIGEVAIEPEMDLRHALVLVVAGEIEMRADLEISHHVKIREKDQEMKYAALEVAWMEVGGEVVLSPVRRIDRVAWTEDLRNAELPPETIDLDHHVKTDGVHFQTTEQEIEKTLGEEVWIFGFLVFFVVENLKHGR